MATVGILQRLLRGLGVLLRGRGRGRKWGNRQP